MVIFFEFVMNEVDFLYLATWGIDGCVCIKVSFCANRMGIRHGNSPETNK